ncbi:MAG: hypothetical protein JXB60_00940 [Candidatus Cloacimonetes bacterium]|nr:hypothetical protein [Candidatus Cloacimonadota bacterium]
MKSSFTGKIRIIIIFLFLIALVQGMIIIQLVNNFNDIQTLKQDILNTVYITIFLQFVLSIILIFYLPVFLRNAFAEINNILKDISQGMYNIELDINTFDRNLDKEFMTVVLEIKKMLRSIAAFDKLKKEKIIEHHNRILAILNLTENGFIIIDNNGNIVYINDKVTDNFSALSEKTNIAETNFPPEIENNIKKYTLNILKAKTKQDSQQFFMPSLKRHIGMNSGIVRGIEGEMCGAVISISNLEKKKQDKPREKEQDN